MEQESLKCPRQIPFIRVVWGKTAGAGGKTSDEAVPKDSLCDAVRIAARCDGVRDRKNLGDGISHGDPKPSGADHGNIIEPVTERHGICDGDTEMRCKLLQRIALVRADIIDLHVVRHGGTDGERFKAFRKVCEQLCAQRRVPCEKLNLLYIRSVLRKETFQLIDGPAQLADHRDRVRIGRERLRLLLKAARHPAAIVHVAVVDHRKRVKIGHDFNGLPTRNSCTINRSRPLNIKRLRAIDRDGVSQKGQRADGLRHRVEETSRRGDDQNTGVCGAFERLPADGRKLLFCIQQRAVKVKCNQLNGACIRMHDLNAQQYRRCGRVDGKASDMPNSRRASWRACRGGRASPRRRIPSVFRPSLSAVWSGGRAMNGRTGSRAGRPCLLGHGGGACGFVRYDSLSILAWNSVFRQ